MWKHDEFHPSLDIHDDDDDESYASSLFLFGRNANKFAFLFVYVLYADIEKEGWAIEFAERELRKEQILIYKASSFRLS